MTELVIPEFTVGDRLRKARELTGLDQDIPTGREQQPPSTAEIKAIRKRIPLRMPAREPSPTHPQALIGAVASASPQLTFIPLRAPRMEPLLRLVAA